MPKSYRSNYLWFFLFSYQIKKVKSPQLFNMEPSEIKDKLESITRKTMSLSTEQNWLFVDTRDMITKFKVGGITPFLNLKKRWVTCSGNTFT